ncbi:MAG: M1 family metallopeptidase [candidate division Zixibacteria bacterium]|nr:M1 family metallopeptidase [candidate division Zixibacteria bacterium]
MKKLAWALLLFPSLSFAQTLPKPFLSYTITGDLDTAKKEFSGRCVVRLENRTPKALDRLIFNLYPNAFRNTNTTFMRESGGLKGEPKEFLDSGFLVVEKVADGSGNDLTAGGRLNETVYTLPLRNPIGSGQTGTVELKFKTHFPRPVERIGWTKDGSFIFAQWYPILAKLDSDGEFRAYPFHYMSEFYSNFADYDVTISLPKGYAFEATGYLLQDSIVGDKKSLHFQAQTVVDFAGMTSQKAKSYSRIFQGVLVTFFGPKSNEAKLDEIFSVAESTLSYCGRTYGPYPYKKLVIAEAPVGAGAGMEFPMFITASFAKLPPLVGRLFFREIIAHEIAHQYWYQLVASNQFEEPWLDEGFTTYTTAEVLERYHPLHPIWATRLGFELSPATFNWLFFQRAALYDSLTSKSWEFLAPGRYFSNVYAKTYLLLSTIERHIGSLRTNVMLQTYYEKYRFSHPTTRDFLKIAGEFVPDSILTPLTKWLYGPPPVCDFAVGNFASKKEKDKVFKGRIELFNRGSFVFPVAVRVTFENGAVKDTAWRGEPKAARMEVTGPAKIRSVEINPGRKLALENDYTNNFKTASGNKAGGWAQVLRMIYGMESITSWLTAL